MRLISTLDRKVLRDLARLRGQLFAIALVITAGVGLFLGMRTTMLTLERTRAAYYAAERFAHVFASLKRAPERVADHLREIPGVQRLQTRVVAEVTLDLPSMTEAATGRLVSLPDDGRAQVNDMRLQSGRMPEPGRGVEVLVSVPFAEAHGFTAGDEFAAVIDGKRQVLRIVGTALSPEFIFSIGPGQLFPDNRRFGVIWMRRAALGPAFDMEGAFNDVSLQLARDASTDAVIERVDAALERYGGVGAIARTEQVSAVFLQNELTQLSTIGLMVPILFLAVAAFLLNIVVGRIVAGQREQIATLKAVGYSDREIGFHYAKLVGMVVGVGSLFGVVLGVWIGGAMTRLYASYYSFPDLLYSVDPRALIQAVGVSVLSAALGTWAAVWRTVRLAPAEAMRPEAPPIYRATLLERIGVSKLVPPAARMVLRELERRPWRAGMSVMGIVMATALVVVTTFTRDSIVYMLNVQFGLTQRESVQLTLVEPREVGVIHEIAHLPGVLDAEPFRSVPVRMRFGPRMKAVAISGQVRGSVLNAILDAELREVELPGDGLVLSRKLADILGVETGETLEVEVLQGERRTHLVPVARIAESFVGLAAYMELSALCRMLGETRSLTGARLTVDEARLEDLQQAVKELPLIAGVSSKRNALRSVQTLLAENIGTTMGISLVFALVLAGGVLYNAARITLAERSRDLASLRVLGFRRGEVATILLGELGVITLISIPLGLVTGRWLVGLLVTSPGFESEQFRLPLVISPATYSIASLVVLFAAALSGWNAWRSMDKVDIVEVLKTRD